MLKLLLNGHSSDQSIDQLSQIWNVAHILEALRQIIKVKWVKGVKALFSYRRVKQLVGSISSVEGFLKFAEEILNIF